MRVQKLVVAVATTVVALTGTVVAANAAGAAGSIGEPLPGNGSVYCVWLTGDNGLYGAGCSVGADPNSVGYSGAAAATFDGNLGAGQYAAAGVCAVGACVLYDVHTDAGHLDNEACVKYYPFDQPFYYYCAYPRVP